MQRLTDWRSRLNAYFLDMKREPLTYGISDCALFAAGAVQAMTGEDPAVAFRGRYTTLRGGLRVLRMAGYRDHIDLTTHLLPEVHPAFAGDGDVASVDTTEGMALGIFSGEVVYVLAPVGLGVRPRTEASKAWKV